MDSYAVTRWGGLIMIVGSIVFGIGSLVRYSGNALAGQALIFVGLPLLVFGIQALYAAQARQAGKTGLLGFGLMTAGLILTMPIAFALLAQFAGVKEAHTIVMFSWGVVPILHLAVLCSSLGGVLFGTASMRAGVFPRWAGLALMGGETANLVLEYTFPMLPILWPISTALLCLGLIGMGWAVWSARTEPAMRLKPATYSR